MIAFLLTAAVGFAPGEPKLYGISADSAFIGIDPKSGKITPLSKPLPAELESQELSAIDSERALYYVVGFNQTSGKCNLVSFSLDTGAVSHSVALPFAPSSFVGVGQNLDIDPTDGTIIVMGHDPSHNLHHSVYTIDPVSFSFSFVADVGGDGKTDLLGTYTVFDFDEKDVYVTFAYNNQTAGRVPVVDYGDSNDVVVQFTKVSLKTLTVTPMDSSLMLTSMAYDSQTKRVYGTRVYKDASTGAYVRTLSFFTPTDPAAGVVDIQPLELTGSIGGIFAFDKHARVHYSLLADKVNRTAFVPSDYCASHGSPCGSGSACCCDPTNPGPTAGQCYGSCYKVDDCSKISSGPDPLSVADFLVGVHIDDGTTVSKAALCSLEKNPQAPIPCPWSIEAA